jgi:hypothetical protein
MRRIKTSLPEALSCIRATLPRFRNNSKPVAKVYPMTPDQVLFNVRPKDAFCFQFFNVQSNTMKNIMAEEIEIGSSTGSTSTAKSDSCKKQKK